MDSYPFYWVAQVNGAYAVRMETVLKKIGMDISRWRVLNIVHEKGTAGISQISDDAIMKLSTVAKLVQRMKEEGLVETRASETDARVTEVSLTPSGLAAVGQVRSQASRIFEQAFHKVPEPDIKKLNETLAAIFRNLTLGVL